MAHIIKSVTFSIKQQQGLCPAATSTCCLKNHTTNCLDGAKATCHSQIVTVEYCFSQLDPHGLEGKPAGEHKQAEINSCSRHAGSAVCLSGLVSAASAVAENDNELVTKLWLATMSTFMHTLYKKHCPFFQGGQQFPPALSAVSKVASGFLLGRNLSPNVLLISVATEQVPRAT